jgi:hypothetical protein
MKQTILTVAMILCCAATFAEGAMDKWPALKSFHEVIAATFHPSMEGNLKPVKEKADELVDRASALSTAPMPQEYNNEKVKMAIAKLQIETKELKTMVSKNEADAAIKTKLSAVHHCFHKIVDLTTKEE